MTIRYDLPRNVLVVTKGHPFERGAFFDMIDALPGQGEHFTWTHVEHPAAAALFRPEEARHFDAILFYDLPGIQFRVGDTPIFHAPPPHFLPDLEALLDRGMPMVFMHHAIAGWPASERYAEIMGGRFLYQPGRLAGRDLPDSGYRHGVTHQVYPVADHPVTAGLEAGFEITDEIYLYEVFENRVIPLMRSRAAFTAEHFYSAKLALAGQMFSNEGWDHAPGSDLIAWAKVEKKSPIVYVQCGDAPAAYENPGFRKLLGNAVAWVMSAEARDFAQSTAAGVS